MNLFSEDEQDNDSHDVLDIINVMNCVQGHLTFFQDPASGKVHARREFIVEGRKPAAIKEMVFERYQRMQDIFDDLMWALNWKLKTGGNHKALFEALAKRETQREKKRDRRRGGDDFDPAYH
jgi:diphthamide synthase subunit DPH2